MADDVKRNQFKKRISDFYIFPVPLGRPWGHTFPIGNENVKIMFILYYFNKCMFDPDYQTCFDEPILFVVVFI